MNLRRFTEEQFQVYLRMHLHGSTLAGFARRIGVSRSYVQAVASGKRPPSDKILKELKLKRLVSYERF